MLICPQRRPKGREAEQSIYYAGISFTDGLRRDGGGLWVFETVQLWQPIAHSQRAICGWSNCTVLFGGGSQKRIAADVRLCSGRGKSKTIRRGPEPRDQIFQHTAVGTGIAHKSAAFLLGALEILYQFGQTGLRTGVIAVG